MINLTDTKVLPRFVFGNFLPRLGAYLIDILLIQTVSTIFLNIYGIFGFWNTGATFGLYNISRVIFYLTYFTLFTKMTNGQTIGKMVFSLRVVSLYHEELTWSDVFIREFVSRYIQKKIKFLYLILFMTKKKQTLADIFSDTSVVSEKDYFDLEHFLTVEKTNNDQLVEE